MGVGELYDELLARVAEELAFSVRATGVGHGSADLADCVRDIRPLSQSFDAVSAMDESDLLCH